ncbi:uncharacterized protein J4E88_000109 [Alternaria novae-zelandiae]|uniref:uncharacterized protein n=1 Tax=Alternaria novae-zelandiae TaxID=430562 RepID=UPI0020C3478D|nr:uncharacterized protein J4E88_000109 [Alternaria novae-zelandiae]KAI4695939.1 hypothetical protein J4E88_000109 [Alternaria novae-zelandiae]
MGKQAIERLHNVPDIMVRALDLEWELSVTLKKLDSWKAKEVERLIKENGVNTQTHRKSNSVIDMDTHKKDVMQEALDWMKEDLDLLKADHEDLRNAREEDLIFFEDEISKLTRRYRRRVGEAVELERKLNTIIAGKHGLVKDDARKISEMQDTNELTSMDTMEMRLELVRRNKVLTQLNEVLTRRFNEVLTQRRNELAGTKPADQGIFEHPQEPSGKNPESTVVEEESDQLHTDHVAMTMESPTFLEPQPNWKNVCDGNEELGNKGPGPDSDEPADDEPADDEPDSDEPDSDEPDSDDQDSDYQGNDNHKTRASIIGPWTARTRSAARMHNKERRENKRLTRAGKSKQSIQASN